ncbi:hypothetical protein [Pseudomonas pharyngis]|uniref:hypothetical protein n=1 Tax=Pseudomonas pharyngis TaxID=2892333 RepID=UPI003FD63681
MAKIKMEALRDPQSGQIFSVQKKSNDLKTFSSLMGAVVSLIAGLAFLYGLLAYNRPELIEVAFANKPALYAILFGGSVGFLTLVTLLARLGSSTFEKMTSLEGRTRFSSSVANVAGWAFSAATGMEFSSVEDSSGKGVKEEAKVEAFSYGAVSEKGHFEAFISNILKSLSAYASSSEITATKLLDKGVAFMAGGLIFYVVVIAIWQVFANLTKPDPHVMYIGMAACSMTFIVIEFLAAWFFKQYRYYVEVSLSCLRVRSVYDRYLLSYYALKEFEGVEGNEARDKIIEALKEDVKWPTYKNGVDNDFNYMIESMGAAHASMEKVKAVFESKQKGRTETKAKVEATSE